MEVIFTPVGAAALLAALFGLIYSTRSAARGLALMIIYGTASSIATPELAVSGLGVGMILFAQLPRLATERKQIFDSDAKALRTPVDVGFLLLGLLATVHMVVGLVRGHAPAMVFGDFYHLMFEIVLPFFVFKFFLRRQTAFEEFLRNVAIGMLVVAVLLLFLLATGLIREIPGTGGVMSHTNFWRFRYSHHFPLCPLTFFTGIALVGQLPRQFRLVFPTIAAMLVTLVLSLKRANWIAYSAVTVVCPWFLSAQRRSLFIALGTVLAVALSLTMVFGPEDLWRPVTTSVVVDRASSLGGGVIAAGNRLEQAQRSLDLILRNPFGYGLGSELQTLQTEEMHYIHNSFLHYGVHAGLLAPLIVIVIVFRAFIDGFRTYLRLPDGLERGAVMGSLMGLVAIFVTSFGEVTINTFFFPMFVCIIYCFPVRTRAVASTHPARTIAHQRVG